MSWHLYSRGLVGFRDVTDCNEKGKGSAWPLRGRIEPLIQGASSHHMLLFTCQQGASNVETFLLSCEIIIPGERALLQMLPAQWQTRSPSKDSRPVQTASCCHVQYLSLRQHCQEFNNPVVKWVSVSPNLWLCFERCFSLILSSDFPVKLLTYFSKYKTSIKSLVLDNGQGCGRHRQIKAAP